MQYQIILVINDEAVRMQFKQILDELGHVVIGLYPDLREYTVQVPALRLDLDPDVIITDYTSTPAVKQLQRVLDSRHTVAAFIFIGADESILDARQEPHIFGRYELPVSPLQTRGALMVAVEALRVVYTLEQAEAARRRRQQETEQYEQTLEILMKREPVECPDRPAAAKFFRKLHTGKRIGKTAYMAAIIKANEVFIPVPGKPENKRWKKPRG